MSQSVIYRSTTTEIKNANISGICNICMATQPFYMILVDVHPINCCRLKLDTALKETREEQMKKRLKSC